MTYPTITTIFSEVYSLEHARFRRTYHTYAMEVLVVNRLHTIRQFIHSKFGLKLKANGRTGEQHLLQTNYQKGAVLILKELLGTGNDMPWQQNYDTHYKQHPLEEIADNFQIRQQIKDRVHCDHAYCVRCNGP